MKNTKFLFVVIILTFLVMYQNIAANGRWLDEEVPYIYDENAVCRREICVGLKQVDKTQNGGLMDFLIIVRLKVNVSKLDIALRVSDEITYYGETKWVDTVKGNMTRYYPIQINLPENDTSAIELQATGKCYGDGVSPLSWGLNRIYFVTTSDTLGLYQYFPKTEKDEPEKQKRSGRVIPGEFPDRDSLYGIPESTDNDVPVINLNDMTGFEKWEPKTRLEYQYEHIRELEKTPLEDDGQLIITRDGKYWLRNKGEYKFRQVEPTRDETTKRVIDSVEALPGDYDLVFVLNYQPYFEFVDSLVDNLQPLEEEGFYRATVSKELWRKIDERGVSIFRWEMYKNILDSKSEKKATPEKKESEPQGSLKKNDLSGLSETVFSFNFEGSWPGPWITCDSNPDYGYDYWGISTFRRYEGQRSVWCAGVGNMTDGISYDYWMNSIMYTDDAIDISLFTNPSLSFYIWYSIEQMANHVLIPEVSTDRINWFGLESITGNSYGWVYKTYPIENDIKDNLYLRFQFISFSPVLSNPAGAYIDNIEVRADYRPDLVCYTPDGWDYPLVPSSITGTHTVNTLYSGGKTYVDWAIKNIGPGNAGPLTVGFFVDFIPIKTWEYDGLLAGDSILFEDYEFVIEGEGAELMIFIEYLYDEIETLNNSWYNTFTWIPPEITFNGYLEYLDINPPDTTAKPMRHVIIELWDEDIIGDDLLGYDITDDYGYFYIGPVDNDDISGTLDVFFVFMR